MVFFYGSEMKHLFICSTPLQLITVTNMKLSLFENDSAVLYINDHSHSYLEMYNQIKDARIFDEVHLLSVKKFNKHWLKKYKVSRYALNAYEYLRYEKTSNKFIVDSNIYDYFWVSFMDRSSWLMFLKFQKYNKKIQLNFFEDGVGSYQLLTIKQNKLDKALSNFLGKNSIFDQMKCLYLYEPGLALNTKHPHVKICSLPKINTTYIKETMNRIFEFHKEEFKLFDSKYIFFDSPFHAPFVDRQQSQIVDELIKLVGDNFKMKLHPATQIDESNYKEHVSEVRTMMELFFLNKDVSNNVFVSVLSTVGITPKLMFGQEPYAIFLYKIVEIGRLPQIGDGFFEFVEFFKKSYNQPERIFIPESMEELENIIEELNEFL